MKESSPEFIRQQAEEMPQDRYADLYGKVSECIIDVLGVDKSQVTPRSVLLDLGAQSVDFVDITFRLEEAFGIRLPQRYLIPDTHTVDTLVGAIAQELAKSPRGTEE